MWTEKDMIYLPPMIKLEYLKKIRVRWIILAIFLVAIWIVMGNPRLGEWYSRSIYPWVSGMLSRFSCLFPFSVSILYTSDAADDRACVDIGARRYI